MAKKSSLLLASLAALAFAVPVAASAAPEVTDNGARLAPFALLQTTNIGGVATETSLGKISCNVWNSTEELVNNNGTTWRAENVGKGTTAPCFLNGMLKTVTDLTVFDIHSAAVGSGTIGMTFIADLGPVTCHFETLSVPFTYTSGGDVIKMVKGDLKGAPAACEPGLITGEWTIETDGGGVVILD